MQIFVWCMHNDTLTNILTAYNAHLGYGTTSFITITIHIPLTTISGYMQTPNNVMKRVIYRVCTYSEKCWTFYAFCIESGAFWIIWICICIHFVLLLLSSNNKSDLIVQFAFGSIATQWVISGTCPEYGAFKIENDLC